MQQLERDFTTGSFHHHFATASFIFISPGRGGCYWKLAVLFPLVLLVLISGDTVDGMRTGRCPAEDCPLEFKSGLYSGNRSCSILSKQECQAEWDQLGLELMLDMDLTGGPGSELCTSDQLQFELNPVVSKTKKLAPFTRLNFTFAVHDEETQLVGFRFLCIQEKLLAYCDSPKPTEELWATQPCRIYDLRPAMELFGDLTFPIEMFSYCFGPILDESYYELKVILYPQNCSTSYYMLIPRPQQISVRFTVREWRPTVWLSTGDPSGLEVRVAEVPSGLNLQGLDFLLYNGTSQELSDRFQLGWQKDGDEDQVIGHVFKDLVAGNYTVKVGAIHPYCPHTYCLPVSLNISLHTDHTTKYVKSRISESGLAMMVLGTLAGVVLSAVLAGFLLVWRRRKQTPDPVMAQDKPVVFILYTDDFEAHRRAVLKFAQYFRDFGHCDVIVDEWEFRQSAANFSPELVLAKLYSADFYLVFFSDGSSVYFSDQSQPKTQSVNSNSGAGLASLNVNSAQPALLTTTGPSLLQLPNNCSNSNSGVLQQRSNNNLSIADQPSFGDVSSRHQTSLMNINNNNTTNHHLSAINNGDSNSSHDSCEHEPDGASERRSRAGDQRLVLKPERVMSELFVPGMKLVLRRLIEDLSSEPISLPRNSTLNSVHTGSFPSTSSAGTTFANSASQFTSFKRLVPVRFSYSPASVFPQFLSQFGAHCHVLPHEIDAVLAQLHGGECTNHLPLASQTREAVDAAAIYVRDRPQWLDDRLVRVGDLDQTGVGRSLPRDAGDLTGFFSEFDNFWQTANQRHFEYQQNNQLQQQQLPINIASNQKDVAYHRMIDNDRSLATTGDSSWTNRSDQSQSFIMPSHRDGLVAYNDSSGGSTNWINSNRPSPRPISQSTGRPGGDQLLNSMNPIGSDKYPFFELPQSDEYATAADRHKLLPVQKYPLLDVADDDDDLS